MSEMPSQGEAKFAPLDSYQTAAQSVMQRFYMAIERQWDLSGQRMFSISPFDGLFPDKVSAQLLLVDSYELWARNQAEIIELSVPIAEADIDEPHPVIDSESGLLPYFALRHSHPDIVGSTDRTLVTPDNYDQLFGEESLITDLSIKLNTFRSVPTNVA